MKIEMYCKYRLKDGRVGWTVEEFGGGEAYMLELEDKALDDWLPTVKSDEFLEKIK